MKRSGFTMIELVFVIVILGILAAVAVPKLTATRTDAKLVAAKTDVATVIADMTSYWTAKGDFKTATAIGDVTNVTLAQTTDIATAGAGVYDYQTGSGTTINCIHFVTTDAGTLALTASTTNADTGAVCTKLKAAFPAKTYTIAGAGVAF